MNADTSTLAFVSAAFFRERAGHPSKEKNVRNKKTFTAFLLAVLQPFVFQLIKNSFLVISTRQVLSATLRSSLSPWQPFLVAFHGVVAVALDYNRFWRLW